MTRSAGTGKYEKLLERCHGLEPVSTAVAYPCEASAWIGVAIDTAANEKHGPRISRADLLGLSGGRAESAAPRSAR